MAHQYIKGSPFYFNEPQFSEFMTKESSPFSLSWPLKPECIHNLIMAMRFSAMFTFQLDNTKRETFPAPNCRNVSCRYVRAMQSRCRMCVRCLYYVSSVAEVVHYLIWRTKNETQILKAFNSRCFCCPSSVQIHKSFKNTHTIQNAW